ncbi:MAG: condensation domain-containing protein [Nakamurella multipartita]
MTTGIIEPPAAGADDLAAVRARLLQRRLAGRAPGRREPTPPATRRGGPIPLSAGQRQMWFLSRLEPDSWEYAAPLVLRLTGALDRTRLQSAIDAVVARHEILRTRYRLVDHRPVQVIDQAAPRRSSSSR